MIRHKPIQRHKITPGAFGIVEGCIGLAKQGFGAGGRTAEGDADTCGHAGREIEGQRFDGRSQFFRNRGGSSFVGQAVDDDNEFLAAEPRDQIAGAQVAAQDVGHALQHLVAGEMTELIVDRLKMIDVDDHHGETTARRIVAQTFQMGAEVTAIVQLGQWISENKSKVNVLISVLGVKASKRAQVGEFEL